MAFRKLGLIATTTATLFAWSAKAIDNGLAKTPQMGWDNWNALACDVSEDLLLQTAKLIVDYGLRDLGYEYVVLDDCWSAGRNASNNNSLLPDLTKFPNGMAAVADALHAMDLKYGMYSDAGSETCGQYAGSLGYETVDANTFAEWGVDYLKYDNCFNEGFSGNQSVSSARYRTMSEALNATGRPILYSLCNWGQDQPWDWGAPIANSWRISGDIYDSFDAPNANCPCDGANAWNCTDPGNHCSVVNIMNKASFITDKGHPGGWNDLDMLEIGNGNMTDAEYVAHFSMWSAVKSALLMGNDIRKIAPADLAILSNPAVIAVNQDPLGTSASRRWIHDNIQMWSGPLKSTTDGQIKDNVVVLFNDNKDATVINATLTDILADYPSDASEHKLSWEVRDLWANRMSTDTAAAIIAGNGPSEGRYNATKTSYADGLAQRNPLLLGNVTTTVHPSGIITANVDGYGAVMFRLRALAG